jgi:hypothetical protein
MLVRKRRLGYNTLAVGTSAIEVVRFTILSLQTRKMVELNPPNRGRVEAQGGGVQESVPWAQREPPTVLKGHEMLDRLRDLLLPAEQRFRVDAFEEARQFMTTASLAVSGGVYAQPRKVSKSFPRKPRRDHRRVDIVVEKGCAFVPDRPS